MSTTESRVYLPTQALSTEQQRRAAALGLALELCKGRSVPIQVVERIAKWIYSGEGDQ